MPKFNINPWDFQEKKCAHNFTKTSTASSTHIHHHHLMKDNATHFTAKHSSVDTINEVLLGKGPNFFIHCSRIIIVYFFEIGSKPSNCYI